jgi:rhodanese-related sulfurtransferase
MPQVLIVGANPLADAVAAHWDDVVRVPGLAAGATFDLLLDADVVLELSGDPATRYLANDAAAVRGIPMIWAAAHGEAGIAWDERGADYRDHAPEEPDAPSPAGEPPTRLADLVVKLTTEALAGAFAPRVVTLDPFAERAYARDAKGARPGSLEERTAVREPDPARSVTAEQLAKLLAGPTTEGIHETPPLLLDVRERPEASFAALPGSVLIPLGELPDRLGELPLDASMVVYCHHGVRSARALEVLEKAGFTRVRHLTGGLDAWSVKVDPEVPRY